MKKNLMFLALAAMGLASCNGGYKKGDNGLLYNIYTDKSGPKIKVGDFLTANLILKNDADSVLMNTYDQGRPAPLILRKPTSPSEAVLGALPLLAEGDSASVKILADSMFRKGTKPPGFKGKYLNYIIKIDKVIPKGKLTEQAFNEEITKYMKGLADVQKNAEPAKLQKYFDENKVKANKTDSGLYYVVTKPGQGPLIAVNDTAVINYVGKQLNGKVFDTSIKEEGIKAKLPGIDQHVFKPMPIVIGQKRVIEGLDMGLRLLNKGAKASLIIPSKLAYGAMGAGSTVPPYTPILFEVEVVDVIHPKPGSLPPAPPVASARQQ